MPDLYARVREVVEDYFRGAGVAVDPAALTPELDLLDSGLIDSTSFLELVAMLEERLGIGIDFLEVDPAAMTTLSGIARSLAALHA